MKNLMLIDDDAHEAFFWRHAIDTEFSDQLALTCHTNVDTALEDMERAKPDIILLDHRVPPYASAGHCLTELAKRDYGGRVFVWSFNEKHNLEQDLDQWPGVELIEKLEYIGMDINKLIRAHFI